MVAGRKQTLLLLPEAPHTIPLSTGWSWGGAGGGGELSARCLAAHIASQGLSFISDLSLFITALHQLFAAQLANSVSSNSGYTFHSVE